ncbi:MAG: hypothetical protein KME38_07610 [Spirirestis rafaelensis WJT71-NPBG6]|nr:hypothetical protein [Spirirestis rafaelensis WJT71-NPBG6]
MDELRAKARVKFTTLQVTQMIAIASFDPQALLSSYKSLEWARNSIISDPTRNYQGNFPTLRTTFF